MLFELATGNLSFRIQQTEPNEDFDLLEEKLNELGDLLKQKVDNNTSPHFHFSYQSLVQVAVVIDANFIIVNFTANLPEMLNYKPEDFVNVPFSELLAEQSAAYMKVLITDDNENVNQAIHLIFQTKEKKLVPTFCTIIKLHTSNQFLVSTITTVLQDTFSDLIINHKSTLQASENGDVIQQVHQYILANLDEPLPTAQVIAARFNISETKLKQGFRHYFNTSVYHFYSEERLKKAHLRITQSNEPIKNIALLCGFGNYLNFYKAFKKKFGYAPSDLKR